MVRAGGAECGDVVKDPLMPAGPGPRLPQMRAGHVGYPQSAPWMCVWYILAKVSPLVHLFSWISLNAHNHVRESR